MFFIIVSASSLAHGQSLADLARRERERKKTKIEGKPVRTNSTKTPPAATTPATPAKTAASAEAQKTAEPTGPTDNKGRGEKFWRDAFAKARTDVKRAEDR